MRYDYIIVGSGTTGLTLAYYLSKLKKKILIIEKKKYIGGAHGVNRINDMFTEHSPRIYINNYLNFIKLLKDMNISFEEIFKKYNFDMLKIFKYSMKNFNIKESLLIMILFLSINENHKRKTMIEFTTKYNFTNKSISFIDKLCKTVDGSDIKNMTQYQFIQIINQNLLYQMYQPKLPNDIFLFKKWKNNLIKNNVNFLLNTEIYNFEINDNRIKKIIVKKDNIFNKINCNNLIFAIPPISLVNILKKSNIPNSFGNLEKLNNFSRKTKYLEFISIIFHWNKKLELKKNWGGLSKNDWDLRFIVLSDYMKFNNKNSKTVISIIISKDKKSSYLNKKANECSEKEIILETFRQLNEEYGNIINVKPIFSYVGYKNSNNESFMITKHGFINYFSKYKNMFNCGIQNGNSNHYFNSLESSVQNALNLIHILEPNSKKLYPVQVIQTLKKLIIKILIVIVLIVIIIIYFLYKK